MTMDSTKTFWEMLLWTMKIPIFSQLYEPQPSAQALEERIETQKIRGTRQFKIMDRIWRGAPTGGLQGYFAVNIYAHKPKWHVSRSLGVILVVC